jgi:diaminopimelate decarboxylase
MTPYEKTVEAIRDANFTREGSQLVLGGVRIADLARDHGTPFYAYDAGIIRARLETLRAALPGFECFYSVKANPNPSLLSLLLQLGCGLEIASRGELELALLCGCPPARLMFAGPGKTRSELELAVVTGLAEIHVESLGEIATLGAIARERGIRTPVSLRVNPAVAAQGASQQMGGKAAAFGLDEELLDEAVQAIRAQPFLRMSGVHVYAGTQNLHAASFEGLYTHILGLAERIRAIAGEPLHTIDFGGGFGVPYFPGESALDLAALRGVMARVLERVRAHPHLARTRLVVEPGRFLVAEAGIYVARVTDLKVSRGTTFAILDGGMSHHLPASGQFGQVVKRNFPIAVANKTGAPGTTTYELAGPLCTPLDIVGRAVTLPDLEVGDLIVILQSGAYSRTTSPLGFLSHYDPPELLVDGGRVRVIRVRGTLVDIVRGTEFAGRLGASAEPAAGRPDLGQVSRPG